MASEDKRFAHCVLLFRSIHDVTAAEYVLKTAGIWCDMVPTPRSLSTNCGMVLEFHGRDLDLVKEAMTTTTARPRCVGIYTCSGTAYEREPWDPS